MEHDLAISNRAAERYLLAEMTPAERDAFEEHYFSCADCAEDVRATSMFVDNMKAVWAGAQQPAAAIAAPPDSPRRALFAWFRPQAAIPALALLALALVYQNTVEIPALKSARVVPATILHAATRGGVPVFKPGQPMLFEIPLETPIAGPVEVRSDTGALVQSIASVTANPDQSIIVSIPAPDLKPARYAVVIGGTHYPFEVR